MSLCASLCIVLHCCTSLQSAVRFFAFLCIALHRSILLQSTAKRCASPCVAVFLCALDEAWPVASVQRVQSACTVLHFRGGGYALVFGLFWFFGFPFSPTISAKGRRPEGPVRKGQPQRPTYLGVHGRAWRRLGDVSAVLVPVCFPVRCASCHCAARFLAAYEVQRLAR